MVATEKASGKVMAKGAAWMIGLRWSVRLLALVRTLILARLLLPEDFGLVALAMMMLAAIEAMMNLRPDLALIQNNKATREHYDTVWTLNVLIGLFTALFLVSVAKLSAGYFAEERLELIVYCFALVVLIHGFQNSGTVEYMKELQFDRVFWMKFSSRVGSFILAVACAVIWRNYWALIVGIASTRIIYVLLSYIVHPFRPRFSLKKWREIFNFSKWLVPGGIVFSIRRGADSFIIGKVLSAGFLGFYEIARTVAEFASAELTSPIRNVLFPAYAKVIDQPDRFQDQFVRSFSLIFVIGIPVSGLICALSLPFVQVVLGENWLPVAPLISVLAIHGFCHLCSAASGAVFLALGKTKYMLFYQMVGALLIVPSVLIGITYFGLVGVAWAAVFSSALATAVALKLALGFTGASILILWKAIWRSIISAGLMMGALAYLTSISEAGNSFWHHLTDLVLFGAFGAMIHFAVLFALWILSGKPAGPEMILVSQIKSYLMRRR